MSQARFILQAITILISYASVNGLPQGGGVSGKPAEFETFDTISLIYITVKSRGFSRYLPPPPAWGKSLTGALLKLLYFMTYGITRTFGSAVCQVRPDSNVDPFMNLSEFEKLNSCVKSVV